MYLMIVTRLSLLMCWSFWFDAGVVDLLGKYVIKNVEQVLILH